MDYATLKFIWWLLVGALLIGFAIMDGHDMGVGALLPFVGKSDTERRVMINSIAPHWEGNQVWFVTAGGPFLQLGHLFTPRHFPVSISPCSRCCGRYFSARSVLITAAR